MNDAEKREFADLAKFVGKKIGGDMEKRANQLHDDILKDMMGGQLDTAVPVQGNSEDEDEDEDEKEANQDGDTVDQLINGIFN